MDQFKHVIVFDMNYFQKPYFLLNELAMLETEELWVIWVIKELHSKAPTVNLQNRYEVSSVISSQSPKLRMIFMI